jgi:hypothetical protein
VSFVVHPAKNSTIADRTKISRQERMDRIYTRRPFQIQPAFKTKFRFSRIPTLRQLSRDAKAG